MIPAAYMCKYREIGGEIRFAIQKYVSVLPIMA